MEDSFLIPKFYSAFVGWIFTSTADGGSLINKMTAEQFLSESHGDRLPGSPINDSVPDKSLIDEKKNSIEPLFEKVGRVRKANT